MKKSITSTIIAAIAILLASCGCYKKGFCSSNVTFYKVPLVCPAAPNIGCGSKSKPVLLGLEKKSNVISEAWLNRSGTVIAVVWKENSSKELQKLTADSVFQENKMDVTLISGKEGKKTKTEFENKQNWYRGTNVDKLSVEEAEIIADRLINRVNAKTPLSKEKSDSLRTGFIQVFTNRFTKNYSSEINSNEQKVFDENKTQMEENILAVGKKYLSELEMQSLNDAIALGLRPTEEENNSCGNKDSKNGCCKPKKKESKGCCSKPNN